MPEAVEFDFLSEDTLRNPFETYRWALDNAPILKIPGENIYGVFSSDLVEEVMRNPEHFSSDWGRFLAGRYSDHPEVKKITDQGHPHLGVMVTTDPPVHTHQRELVNMAFSKPRVEAMAGEIRQIVIDLIEGFIDRGSCEFNADFAIHLPIQIIASQYGLADVPKERVKRWVLAFSDRAGGLASLDREIECARNVLEFESAMAVRIEARRKKPCDDLLSDLVNARIAGERPLNDAELMGILQQIVTAGTESTSNMLGMGLLTLIRNPDKMREVREDRSRIPNMVEEMLRFDTSVCGTFRLTTKDLQLGGVTIPKDSRVMARLAAANHDAGLFENPDEFDLSRKNVYRHYSFGRGIHFCIGNLLARREMAIAFEELLGRLDNITLSEVDPPYYLSVLTRGLAKLNITFDKSISQ